MSWEIILGTVFVLVLVEILLVVDFYFQFYVNPKYIEAPEQRDVL